MNRREGVGLLTGLALGGGTVALIGMTTPSLSISLLTVAAMGVLAMMAGVPDDWE